MVMTRGQMISVMEEEQLHKINILKRIFEERYLMEERIQWIFKGIQKAMQEKKDTFEARICVSEHFVNGIEPLRIWDFVMEDETMEFFTKRWFLNKRIYDKKKDGFEIFDFLQEILRFERSVEGLLEELLMNSNSMEKVLNELHQNSFEAKIIKKDKWEYAISVTLE
ncbi:hypothetical protein NST28_31415 [Paenibacillus sp. FSL R10-2791]|uniref:hypothetical protein n=1 Tax=unclassified Paenibacillus TaxID=185978 RepID=UPI0030FA978B